MLARLEQYTCLLHRLYLYLLLYFANISHGPVLYQDHPNCNQSSAEYEHCIPQDGHPFDKGNVLYMNSASYLMIFVDKDVFKDEYVSIYSYAYT